MYLVDPVAVVLHLCPFGATEFNLPDNIADLFEVPRSSAGNKIHHEEVCLEFPVPVIERPLPGS